MIRKLWIILTVLIALSVPLFAGGAEESQTGNGGSTVKGDELYSMVVFTKGAEYFNWCYAGMRDAAAILGDHVKTELQGPAEWDASLEARTLEQVIVKQPKGILVAAADETTLNSSIGKALSQNIAVIGFDSDAPLQLN